MNTAVVRSVVLWSVALASVGMADAKEMQKTAIAGKTTRMQKYFAWDSDCKFKRFSLDIVSQPSHGRLRPKFEDEVLQASNVRTGTIGKCDGKVIRAAAIYYTPNRSFVGADEFTVSLTENGVQQMLDHYVVTVSSP